MAACSGCTCTLNRKSSWSHESRIPVPKLNDKTVREIEAGSRHSDPVNDKGEADRQIGDSRIPLGTTGCDHLSLVLLSILLNGTAFFFHSRVCFRESSHFSLRGRFLQGTAAFPSKPRNSGHLRLARVQEHRAGLSEVVVLGVVAASAV